MVSNYRLYTQHLKQHKDGSLEGENKLSRILWKNIRILAFNLDDLYDNEQKSDIIGLHGFEKTHCGKCVENMLQGSKGETKKTVVEKLR